MNTNNITDFIGGSWRRELGKDPKIAQKSERIVPPDHDCREESCPVCLKYNGEGKI